MPKGRVSICSPGDPIVRVSKHPRVSWWPPGNLLSQRPATASQYDDDDPAAADDDDGGAQASLSQGIQHSVFNVCI